MCLFLTFYVERLRFTSFEMRHRQRPSSLPFPDDFVFSKKELPIDFSLFLLSFESFFFRCCVEKLFEWGGNNVYSEKKSLQCPMSFQTRIAPKMVQSSQLLRTCAFHSMTRSSQKNVITIKQISLKAKSAFYYKES